MTDVKKTVSLANFRANTKVHLRRLKRTGRLEILTINGKAELIVQNAAAYEETLDAIRGIQRGLDEMKAGKGKPAREALDRIRAKYKIPRGRAKKMHNSIGKYVGVLKGCGLRTEDVVGPMRGRQP